MLDKSLISIGKSAYFDYFATDPGVCHEFARRGLLLGGSTGTVLAAIRQYESRIERDACIVAISPDMGDRYLDTIYSEEWCRSHFGQTNLETTEAGGIEFTNNFHVSS